MSLAPTIRPMVRDDIGAVLAMVESLNRTGHEADPRYVLAEGWLDEMRQIVLEDWFGRFHLFPTAYVADVDAVLVGFVQGGVVPLAPLLTRPPTVRIGNLWVEPEHRRRGIARELVTTYVATARAKGFPWVEVGTLAKDERAVAFWRALGFDDWRVMLLNAAT